MLEPDLAAVLERLRACAAYDGLTLTELLEDVADDLEDQQADETPPITKVMREAPGRRPGTPSQHEF